MLSEFGTNSVQLRERKNGFLVPKRHWMHLDFLSFLLESRGSSRFFHWTIANDNVLIIHYLGGQVRNMVWGHLSEMLLYRASEATTLVNTCTLADFCVVSKAREHTVLPHVPCPFALPIQP